MEDNEEARGVKNLDYKNASSETVTNSRTFHDLQITRIFMSVGRAPSNPRHLGNDSSLRRDFRQDESRAGCHAVVLGARWDFPKFSRPVP